MSTRESTVDGSRTGLRALRSLHGGVTDAGPGSLCVLTLTGGVCLAPSEGARLSFGRNRPEVDLCVGENDLHISRVHGRLVRGDGRWWMSNTGRLPIRLATSVLLHRGGEPVPLDVGYTPLFLRGSRNRTHMVEMFVAGVDGGTPAPRPDSPTEPPRRWRLTENEHLALTALGQRFLLYDPDPQPLTLHQAAEFLAELQPGAAWTAKRVEHIVFRVRNRLSGSGVPGLRRDEVGGPLGAALTVNLLRELVLSGTLGPLDLARLEQPD